jgi:hypothetical protein
MEVLSGLFGLIVVVTLALALLLGFFTYAVWE